MHVSPTSHGDVDVVILEGSSPSALGATVDVLAAANRLGADPAYTTRIVSASTGPVSLRHGVFAEAVAFADAAPADTIVVAGLGSAGPGEIDERLRQCDARAAARWLADAAAVGRTVAASCTGVFLLGDAGILDGRRCTTTWWLAGALAARHPRVAVVPDELVVTDGDVLTAGAAFAHVDLVLALVERTGGTALHQEVERRMAHHRRSSQADYSSSGPFATLDPILAAVEAHTLGNLCGRITLADLASAARTSSRTLDRKVRAATGLAPLALVQRIRLQAALHALRHTDATTERIARDVGFDDASSLYRLVKRATGASPRQHRSRRSVPSSAALYGDTSVGGPR